MPSASPSAAKEFGALVRDARRLRDWSQDELAAESGVSQSSISFYECGSVEPSLRSAVLLATSLALDVNLLADLYRPAAAPLIADRKPRKRRMQVAS